MICTICQADDSIDENHDVSLHGFGGFTHMFCNDCHNLVLEQLIQCEEYIDFVVMSERQELNVEDYFDTAEELAVWDEHVHRSIFHANLVAYEAYKRILKRLRH